MTREQQLFLVAAVTALVSCTSSPSTDAGMDAPASDAANDAHEVADSSADADAAPPPVPVTVMTDRGPVAGLARGAVESFLGIPFAAPPVGPLRFRPPQLPDSWTTPLDATQQPPACPQLASDGTLGTSSEDCLRLDVWAPTNRTGPVPVMVWIYGGGFVTGFAGNPLFDGTHFAEHGVMLVALQYRLGPLGFLAHPALVAEDPVHHSAGNYGLMDQQFALQWVQRNAAAFGGDPSNVTLFGESAGGISVCANMLSPASAGLFQRAIGESGTCVFLTTPLQATSNTALEPAVSLGQRLATAVHCDTASDVAACLRGVPALDLINAVPSGALDKNVAIGPAHWVPNGDRWLLPPSPWSSVISGGLGPVDLITGANADEGSGFALMYNIANDTDYAMYVQALVPAHVNDILTLYSSATYGSASKAFSAFVTDAVFICPARRMALVQSMQRPHTYLYEFTRVNPWATVLMLGAFHGAEVPYVFGNFVSPFTLTHVDQQLSDTMMGYWTRFAATGDPNGAGALAWPTYDGTGDAYITFDQTLSVMTALHADKCATLDPWIDAT